MNDEELVKRTVAMLTKLRHLGAADRLYIFSPFFKPVDLPMTTIFGAVIFYPSYNDFSQDQIQGFKQAVNDFSDILVGYVIIGKDAFDALGMNNVKTGQAHDYKPLTASKSSELRKALSGGRAVKVGRFDLSMMNPGWLKSNEAHNTVEIDPMHTMKEATWDSDEMPVHNVAETPSEAVQCALEMLNSMFGECTHNAIQLQEMEEMLEDSVAPYHIEMTPSKDGIQVVGQNHTGVCLYNNDGELYWEF